MSRVKDRRSLSKIGVVSMESCESCSELIQDELCYKVERKGHPGSYIHLSCSKGGLDNFRLKPDFNHPISGGERYQFYFPNGYLVQIEECKSNEKPYNLNAYRASGLKEYGTHVFVASKDGIDVGECNIILDIMSTWDK